MARKQIKVSRRMLFTWFMLAGLIFFFSPQNVTNKFQFAFARIFRWPLSLGRNAALSATTSRSLNDMVGRRKYDQLQNHLANVIEQRDQAYKEIEKLSGLRKLRPLADAKILIADVITTNTAESVNELIINAGKADGIVNGQFVLGDNSIIGTIRDAGLHTAQVDLITSAGSRLEVRIGKLNVFRIMEGTGNGLARISMLSRDYKVKAGNNVYVRKKGGFLDSPLITGRVSRCGPADESPLMWDITVELICDTASLNNVAIIIMNQYK